MSEPITELTKVERAYLVGARPPGLSEREAREHLQELEELVRTLGFPIAGGVVVPIQQLNPAWLIGTGKVDWIESELRRLDADLLIFDDDLRPGQQRNWEKKLGDVCVIDRQEVILDIFAGRARTPEARLQVQLARLEYSLPRLRRAWLHLERQRNASGARGGAGEMQIETDRRLVREQIIRIKQKLKAVQQRRETQRKRRGIRPMPGVAIVGYTNAGKSTLFNALTRGGVRCEDKLFATLDPTTRRLTLPDRRELLLTDTVGFIHKLPHDLVESFKATLEEAVHADLLVHVADAGHPQCREQIATTRAVLKELGAEDKPSILALNKIDLLDGAMPAPEFYDGRDRTIPISAKTGAGLDRLLDALAELYPEPARLLELKIPLERFDLVSLLHREGRVLHQEHAEDGVMLRVMLPLRLLDRVQNLTVAPAQSPAPVEQACEHPV